LTIRKHAGLTGEELKRRREYVKQIVESFFDRQYILKNGPWGREMAGIILRAKWFLLVRKHLKTIEIRCWYSSHRGQWILKCTASIPNELVQEVVPHEILYAELYDVQEITTAIELWEVGQKACIISASGAKSPNDLWSWAKKHLGGKNGKLYAFYLKNVKCFKSTITYKPKGRCVTQFRIRE